ncbi:hypothetical protein J42TS3_35590 [Paenibacillus vini]|uniref:Uncharacterized protein n=1 Tax=Paenibacillus vini TaxID=1476024 RepID=A0ABQ4MEU4_9BACL|nr:hypothetical protein J42TS3_35590 [Paenibacillus vini]
MLTYPMYAPLLSPYLHPTFSVLKTLLFELALYVRSGHHNFELASFPYIYASAETFVSLSFDLKAKEGFVSSKLSYPRRVV